MAAGMGARYGGPKQLEPLGPTGESLFEYSVFDALRAGFGRIVFVIRDENAAAFAAIGSRIEPHAEVRFVFQEPAQLPAWFTPPPDRRKPWGTVHALLAARHVLRGPFAALNADDYYGAEAVRIAADFLQRVPDQHALIAMRLGQTLSEHGPVTRALCRVADGWLTDLTEVRGLQRTSTGVVAEDGRSLDESRLVSMNFWVLTASVLTVLADRFDAFLRRSGQDSTAELPLPDAFGELVRERQLRVRVLQAPGPWAGITYREDRIAVAARIRALVQAGDYPESLWS
jgi:hypothetical protein